MEITAKRTEKRSWKYLLNFLVCNPVPHGASPDPLLPVHPNLSLKVFSLPSSSKSPTSTINKAFCFYHLPLAEQESEITSHSNISLENPLILCLEFWIHCDWRQIFPFQMFPCMGARAWLHLLFPPHCRDFHPTREHYPLVTKQADFNMLSR